VAEAIGAQEQRSLHGAGVCTAETAGGVGDQRAIVKQDGAWSHGRIGNIAARNKRNLAVCGGRHVLCARARRTGELAGASERCDYGHGGEQKHDE